MLYETALRGEARQRLAEIGRADILVGIPSYNNAIRKVEPSYD